MAQTFRVRLTGQRDGWFLATCDGPVCIARGRSEAEALDRIRAEIRYRLEFCPCSGIADDYVQLEIVHGR